MEGPDGMVRRFPSFPYEPYEVQQRLMESMYDTLERGGVGLFESPTGTGKTLSMLCSSLQWLLENRRKTKQEKSECERRSRSGSETSDGEDPSWVREFDSTRDADGFHEAQSEVERSSRPTQALEACSRGLGEEAEVKFNGKDNKNAGKYCEDVPTTSDDEDGGIGNIFQAVETCVDKGTRIFFCSRTHSQLSQVVGEFRKLRLECDVSLSVVASRQLLCINESVKKLNGNSNINDKCLDLQRKSNKRSSSESKDGLPKEKCTSGCPYMHQKEFQISDQARKSLLQPMDIEEVVQLGIRSGTCPYYSSRKAAETGDLVLLTYQALFHKDVREAMGISLEGNVVIIDEAHNVVEAVREIHSCVISLASINAASLQLSSYFHHVRGKLSPDLNRGVRVLISLANKILEIMKGAHFAGESRKDMDKSEHAGGQMVWTINEFLFAAGLDNFNLFQLLDQAKQSKLVLRISSYVGSARLKLSDKAPPENTSSIYSFVEFLQALCHGNSDGRVLLHGGAAEDDVCLKFMMLNTNHAFREVAESARSVILAGGTLTPMEDIQTQLLWGVLQSRITKFSCGHVVSRDRILPLTIAAGPSGRKLMFTHPQRSSSETIDELGRVVQSIVPRIPGGVVIFFPSYVYEAQVYARWTAVGVLSRLREAKKVVREPRAAADVEKVLDTYSKAANDGGAILLSIIGGKMSEGINFGDNMGRCVLVVGLPYPNPHSLEIKEKMKYIDGLGESLVKKSKGMDHLENICMKAVNQSIGRVIRHKLDYAAIVLVDSRWTDQNSCGKRTPMSKLATWIRENMAETTMQFQDMLGSLDTFFKRHQDEKSSTGHFS